DYYCQVWDSSTDHWDSTRDHWVF
nr:immunoglobulin light chain junction region [Macaca mulatta]MOX78713.1 immunoglobulin light chain junction region [Macaca mulatta]MOX78837.1 immunoglobulin light chain junction region [Macaca mulatta]MOX78897.1 immunoglobulin light chain junction region [Macaca mulatta]MOX80015.1 immunoglobulin light chain junction region [Macaca mulatta]